MKGSPACCWFLVAFLLAACHSKEIPSPNPLAETGVLDLSHWDFSRQGPVSLNGEWTLYWQQLYGPADFVRGSPGLLQYVPVPYSWNSYPRKGGNLGGDGFATYRLRVLLSKPSPEKLALHLPLIYTAAKVWVNNQPLYHSGTVGKNPAATLPQYRPEVIDFMPDQQQIDIIIQVANFHYSDGGIRRPILLGTQASLRDDWLRSFATELWLTGSIFIMALYHLGIFLIRRRDASPLHFGLFCLLIVLRILVTGEYTVNLFLEPDWWGMIRIEYLTFTLGTAVFSTFVYSVFRAVFPRKILLVILAVSAVFTGIVLGCTPRFFTAAIVPFQLFVALIALYLLYLIGRACWYKIEGSHAFLWGYAAMMVTFFNDLLHANGVIQTGQYISLGLFLFIFSQAFLLARRFSGAFSDLESSNRQLLETNTFIEEQNEELQRLNAELDGFVYRTSHDLRAPIASVLGLIDIARHENDLTQIRYYLDLKEKSLKKLDGVIRDIIDYSKNKSLGMDISPIDFTVQVTETFASHDYMENAKLIDKTVEWRAQDAFYSDRRRIDIVINNLVSNAVRYYNPSQAQPFIKVKIVSDSEWAVIELIDNGLGIAKEYQTRIFDMFFRLSNHGNGTGLGLYVVKETVQKLGGQIEVESVVNQGTLFRVRLPNLQPVGIPLK